MGHIIKTENLSKYFDDIKAVNNVSLKIDKGEIYGFLGLNGAGKTTTIRMLLGMIKPTNGSISILNEKVSSKSSILWGRVGYLVETPHAYPELTVWENLEIIRKLRLISDKKTTDHIIDKLRLFPYRDRKVSHLSLGNNQRLGLAKALLHNPDILILDEPDNGLDPVGIVEMRELFKDLSERHGVTIFISSHILGEISKLANRIGIIHEGKLLQELNSRKLDNLLNKRLIVGARDIKAAQSKLKEEKYSVTLSEGSSLEITDRRALENPEEVAKLLVSSGIRLTTLKVEEEDLESYFLRIVGGK